MNFKLYSFIFCQEDIGTLAPPQASNIEPPLQVQESVPEAVARGQESVEEPTVAPQTVAKDQEPTVIPSAPGPVVQQEMQENLAPAVCPPAAAQEVVPLLNLCEAAEKADVIVQEVLAELACPEKGKMTEKEIQTRPQSKKMPSNPDQVIILRVPANRKHMQLCEWVYEGKLQDRCVFVTYMCVVTLVCVVRTYICVPFVLLFVLYDDMFVLRVVTSYSRTATKYARGQTFFQCSRNNT